MVRLRILWRYGILHGHPEPGAQAPNYLQYLSNKAWIILIGQEPELKLNIHMLQFICAVVISREMAVILVIRLSLHAEIRPYTFFSQVVNRAQAIYARITVNGPAALNKEGICIIVVSPWNQVKAKINTARKQMNPLRKKGKSEK